MVRWSVTGLVTGSVNGLVTALLLAIAMPAAGQAPSVATPFLSPDHWAVDAARRASLLGFAPRELGWGDGSLTQAAAGQTLLAASERSAVQGSPLRDAIAAEWRRFTKEFPGVAARLATDTDEVAGTV